MANIRTARRSGLVLRGGRNRRDSIWAFVQTSLVSIGSAGSSVLAFSLSAGALALRPFTIVRTRLNWYARSDVFTGAENWGGAIGFAVVSDQAIAIGVTAVPTPLTDQGSDLFFVYDEMFGQFGGTMVEEVGARKEIDSKAMRKVEDGQDLAITMEAGASAIAKSLVSTIGGRFLIKLH